MGKFVVEDGESPLSLSADDSISTVQSLTRNFFRLATCCAIERFPFLSKWNTREEEEEIQYLLETTETEAAFLRQSLFEHMPPTIRFHSQLKTVKQPSSDRHKKLFWAHNPLLPNPMRHILRQNHFSIVPMEEESGWLGFWGRHWKTSDYTGLSINQKVNHYPGSFHLGRKDRIWIHIKEFEEKYPGHFDFMPKTFIMPEDLDDLISYLKEDEINAVILKPPASSRGMGISIVSNPIDLPELDMTQKKAKFWVAQEYIVNPLLINNKKFDLRIYAYVPTLDPLTIYMYDDGLVRFASLPYEQSSFDNQYIHLTNFSINKYAQQEGMTGSPVDKWSLKEFWAYIDSMGLDSGKLHAKIKDIVIKTIISCESYIRDHMTIHKSEMVNCHELFGFDILLDSNLDVHLLEVNISPSLQASTAIDKQVKWPLIRDVLNMCRYPFPVCGQTLDNSAGNATRHCPGNFTSDCKEKILSVMSSYRMNLDIDSSIIHPENLVGADIRCLCTFEDEYNCKGNFDLVFPGCDDSDIQHYFQFIKNPTYFDILLNVWCLHRFHDDGDVWLKVLQRMCVYGNHIALEELRCPQTPPEKPSDVLLVALENASPTASVL